MRKSSQPSMRAASWISQGMEFMKKVRAMIRLYTLTRPTISIARRVLSRPKLFMFRYSGMVPPPKYMVNMNTPIRKFRPFRSRLESA